MKRKYHSLISIKLCFFLLIVQSAPPLMFFNSKVVAQEQESSTCQKILDQAQRLYYEGHFTEAVNLVKSCLTDSKITKSERINAYKILSQVAMALDNFEQAKEIIRQMLKLDPEYQPTIEEEPPRFIELVETVRMESSTAAAKSTLEKQDSKIPGWFYYTVAGVAVATGTYFFMTNGDQSAKKKDKILDSPPDWPNR